MKKFIIKSGAWSEEFNGTLEDAIEIADERVTYNQEDMKILDENGKEAATRTWYGSLDGIEDCEDAIEFGSYGYYTDWSIEN
jgi:hypothetical protein